MELARLPKIKVSNSSQYAREDDLEAPIMGYEIRQPCKRHTVYKIYVHYSDRQGWFVYRRYREFHKLMLDLKKLFPAKEFTLPPKRYFGDNFDPRFLNNRRQGLQGFLYMITRQRDVQKSPPVSEFLFLNNPPTAYDDIVQCRAVIEQLKATVEKLEAEKSDHHTNLTSSSGQIVELHDQKQAVLAALRCERQQNGRKHYPGDDLSLMFEYRSLPEVCRVDVSSFLVRKPPAYLARKFEDKTRKEEAKTSREHEHQGTLGLTRPRALTPPRLEHGRADIQKDRQRDLVRKSQPHIEFKSPNSKEKRQVASRDKETVSSNGEFQSFYDLKQRRRSMPGAVEFHRVNNMLKAMNHMKIEAVPRPTTLAVPDLTRPRSYSASPGTDDPCRNQTLRPSADRCRREASSENSKKSIGWTSLKDLRKLKGRS